MQNIEKFMSKVQKQPDGCWIWTGANNYQYGQFMYHDEIYAHRVSFVLHKHEIPLGMFVLHKCDVPLCVNPDHLFLGTQKDNMQDKLNKKRQAVTKKILFAPMDATEIIDCLGGTFAVAKICRISPPAVSQWRNNGMPNNKLILLAADLEKKSNGRWSRKEIPNWSQIWPDLR